MTATNLNLPLLVLSRVCTSAVFMTYPACLSALLVEWGMTATEGGVIQGGFTICFALSLLATSFLSDRYGARIVFISSTLAVALSSFLFALAAEDFWSALLLLGLIGLAQGGTYTPSIMLVSVHAKVGRKGASIGWVLAGMSAGYIVSIFLATVLIEHYNYKAAFLTAAVLTFLGWLFALLATNSVTNTISSISHGNAEFTVAKKRRSKLLTLGYIGHCWELMGMWAWIPAFIAVAVERQESLSALTIGLWTALSLHLSGFFASFISGYAADRYGTRPVLIGFAVLGMLCSLSIGWIQESSPWILFAAVAVYGFSSIGDSAVLSSAMTDSVPAEHLGKALGVRSILGMGAGAIAPISFGFALDFSPQTMEWGIAFVTLAIGGMLAVICAWKLDNAK